jgi:acid stress chaperone HdeB
LRSRSDFVYDDGPENGVSDEAIIDTDVFAENAKKFGTYCG